MHPIKATAPLIVATLLISCLVTAGPSSRRVRAVAASTHPLWYTADPMYQIYPRSFKDSDGDGVGDIPGIISKLDYLRDLGVKSIWLSPFYPSPGADFGYDIKDFYDVDPLFGTLEDFKRLVAEAKTRGLKVVVDFVVGHASIESDYFKHSVKREGRFTDYFMWSDGKVLENGTRVPPNNWLSRFGGSAWTWNLDRQQFYYHAYLKEQANFNHRNPEVEREMRRILRHWFELGVGGVRVDAVPRMFVAANLSLDEPRSFKPGVGPNEREYLDNIYTDSQPEIMGAIRDYMTVVSEFGGLMILETGEENKTILDEYYKAGAVPFNMMFTRGPMNGREINASISEYLMKLSSSSIPNFVTGSHDVRRVSSRIGQEFCNAYNVLLMTLPCLATTYYGEEIGMREPNITWEQNIDPKGAFYGPTGYAEHTRDYERSPMQWSAGPMAGFTTGNSSWLPIPDSYRTINVKDQTAAKDGSPPELLIYKALVKMRSFYPAFSRGLYRHALVDDEVFSFIREFGQTGRFLIAINVGHRIVTRDFSPHTQSTSVRVILDTTWDKQTILNGETGSNPSLLMSSITLLPGQAIVVMLGPREDDIVG